MAAGQLAPSRLAARISQMPQDLNYSQSGFSRQSTA